MIEITRNLYYYTKEGTLRFRESSPLKEECDHQVCNCTKAVTERPAGEPNQKQQYVEFLSKDNDYNYEVGLAGTGCSFTLRWPGEVWDKDHKWCSKNHAYYWFHGKDALQVEIIKEGYGRTNCFFGKIYKGNCVDISKMFNGHSNSRIVDLTVKRPDEVWAHYCGCGQEAQCSFRETDETQGWRQAYSIQENLSLRARTYDQDFVSDVEKIRVAVENDKPLLAGAEYLCRWFSWVTRNLDQTEMFRCADYCHKNAWKEI